MQGKIRPLRRDKIKRILESNGFILVKQTHGRHLKYRKYDKETKKTLTALVSHCSEIQPFVIRCIIRQSKKPEYEFY